MNREQARERLRELGRLEDDWFTLRPTDEPDHFTVEAGFGGAADVFLSDRWVEVCAIRPLDRLMQAAGESVRGRGALLCATMLPRDPRRVAFRGRVYLDGFSEHAFFVMAGEVLQLAGPATDADREQRLEQHEDAVPAVADAGTVVEEFDAGEEVEVLPVDVMVESHEPEQDEILSEPAIPDPAPEMHEPEPIGTSIPAAEPEPRHGAVADTYPGLRVHPVEESDSDERSTPIMSEPMPPEREITPTIQIPRGGSMPEAAPVAVAGPRPCPVCGEAVQPGERFCIGCGAQIPPGFFEQAAPASGWSRPSGSPAADEPHPPAEQTVECRHCHFVNPIANRFCQGCGSRLAE